MVDQAAVLKHVAKQFRDSEVPAADLKQLMPFVLWLVDSKVDHDGLEFREGAHQRLQDGLKVADKDVSRARKHRCRG